MTRLGYTLDQFGYNIFTHDDIIYATHHLLTMSYIMVLPGLSPLCYKFKIDFRVGEAFKATWTRYTRSRWVLNGLLNSKLRSITLCGNQSARDIIESRNVNMDE